MSAIWLKLGVILCLSCTALNASETSGVLLKNLGGMITIQCRTSAVNQENLEVKKGINEEVAVLYQDGKTKKETIGKEFTGRLQTHGGFPNIDIVIKNLTSDDTGPYWCLYKRFDQQTYKNEITRGTGHVLLVMKGNQPDECNTSKEHLALVSIVISAAVVLCIIMGVLIWFIKTKTTKAKRLRVPIEDVYEDMRGRR